MSGLFSSPPPPPPLPPLPPTPPPYPDIQRAQETVRRNEALSKKPRGRGATLLTGERGDMSRPRTESGGNLPGGKMLLGQ